jgi:hypothetical protein
MTSDDLTAWAAISFGGAVSVAASVAATTLLLEERSRSRQPPEPRVVEVVRVSPPPAPIVDFAIIRSPATLEIMVGPEGSSTGWEPTKRLEIHTVPSR